MSNQVIWGTSIAPASFSLRRRATSEGDLRVTSDGAVRVAYVAPPQIVFLRKTSAGDQRVTSDGARRVTIDGLAGPQYFVTADVTTDGGEPFEFTHTTNPWQPDAQGGEAVFKWAYVTLAWSMSATIRLSAIVDGNGEDIVFDNGDIGELVRSTFTLEQQGGSLQRKVAVFAVPLMYRIMRSGAEVSRMNLRGEQLQLVIESTGPLGVGELQLDGLQVDVKPVRKALTRSVQSP